MLVVLEWCDRDTTIPTCDYTAAEQECLSSAGLLTQLRQLSRHLPCALVTLHSCTVANQLDLYVLSDPGQRLTLKDPNGGSAGCHPFIYITGHSNLTATGSTGTYCQLNSPDINPGPFSGTAYLRIVNQPSFAFQCKTVASMVWVYNVSGDIVNSNSYAIKDAVCIWTCNWDAGIQKGAWGPSLIPYSNVDGTIPAGGTTTIASGYSLCCGESWNDNRNTIHRSSISCNRSDLSISYKPLSMFTPATSNWTELLALSQVIQLQEKSRWYYIP